MLITHRLSTVRDADVIHVLERGRLVESGRWEALLDRRGWQVWCAGQGAGHSGDGLVAADFLDKLRGHYEAAPQMSTPQRPKEEDGSEAGACL